MNMMQATLTVTLKEASLAKQVQSLIHRIAIQRPLSVLGHSVGRDRITLHVAGERLDVYVLTNAVASSFPQVRVKLEAGEAGGSAAPARRALLRAASF